MENSKWEEVSDIGDGWYPDCRKENSKISIIRDACPYYLFSFITEKTLFIRGRGEIWRFHPSIEKWSFVTNKVSAGIGCNSRDINVRLFQPFEEGHLFSGTIVEKAPWAFQTFLGVTQYGLIVGPDIYHGDMFYIYKSIKNGKLNDFFQKDVNPRTVLVNYECYLSDHLFVFPVFDYDQHFLSNDHKQVIYVFNPRIRNRNKLCRIISNIETRKSTIEFFDLPICLPEYIIKINQNILYFIPYPFQCTIGELLSRIGSFNLLTYTYTEQTCSINKDNLIDFDRIFGGIESLYNIRINVASINIDIDKIRCVLIKNSIFYYCILDLLTMTWHLPWRREMLSSPSFLEIYGENHNEILDCQTFYFPLSLINPKKINNKIYVLKDHYILWMAGGEPIYNDIKDIDVRFVVDNEKKHGYLLATQSESTVILKIDLEASEPNLGKIAIKKVLENLSSKEINNYQHLRDIGIPKRWIQIINNN